jgi:GT2 family glycosyltransferase
MDTEIAIEGGDPRLTEGNSLPDLAAAPGVPATAVQSDETAAGFVDLYGYVGNLSGWLFCGWIARRDYGTGVETADVIALFEQGEVTGKAAVVCFRRDDLKDRGCGVLIFVSFAAQPQWNFLHLRILSDGAAYRANGGSRSSKLKAADLVREIKPLVEDRVATGEARQTLTALLSRIYVGQDTIDILAGTVRLEIDEAILCPPGGLLLIGWRLFAPGVVKLVRAGSGALMQEIRFEEGMPIARHDVAGAVPGVYAAFADARCGFAIYLPNCVADGEPAHLEVETVAGQVALRPIRPSMLVGVEAIKRILSEADVRFTELDTVFDRVLGPAIAALNADRLATVVNPTTIEFGTIPSRPRCSVIVPLHGRIDFLEYQMALFSVHGAHPNVEFIYVLDDPLRRRELENLAQSVYARFEIPFRLLLLPANVGYGPANNHGLRSARGDYVCFLNSDVVPGSPHWIEQLTADLAQHTNIGVIGPRLLYEDGSIQHEGCIYRPLQEFGGWMYVDHDHRGRRPGPERGLRFVPAITGACMVMQRWLAEELGGFDEAFVIGDFEDSDLCKKILAYGLTCAVNRDVHLYHLERKSQVSSAQRWRQNLTLYNAWVHQRRWYPAAAPGKLAPPSADVPERAARVVSTP